MTNVDPQTILGPKASLTKLAWANLPKTGNSAFSAFMTKVVPIMAAESAASTTLAEPVVASVQVQLADQGRPTTALPGPAAKGDENSESPAVHSVTTVPEAAPIKTETPTLPHDLQQVLTAHKVDAKPQTVNFAPIEADDVSVGGQAQPSKSIVVPSAPRSAERGLARHWASTETLQKASDLVEKTEAIEPLSGSEQATNVPVTAGSVPEKAKAAEIDSVLSVEQVSLVPKPDVPPDPPPNEIAARTDVSLTAGIETALKPVPELITAQPKTAQDHKPAYQPSKIAAVQFLTDYETTAPAIHEAAPHLPAVSIAPETETEVAQFETPDQKPVSTPAWVTDKVAAAITPEAVHVTASPDQMPLTPPKAAPPSLPPASTFASDIGPAPVPLKNETHNSDKAHSESSDKTAATGFTMPQPTALVIVEPAISANPTPAKPEPALHPIKSEVPRFEISSQKLVPQGSEIPVTAPAFPNLANIEKPINERLTSVAQPTFAKPENTPELRPIAPVPYIATPQVAAIAPPPEQVEGGRATETPTVSAMPSAPKQMTQNAYSDRAKVAPHPAQALPGSAAKPLPNALTETPDLPAAPRQWGDTFGNLPALPPPTATIHPGPTTLVVHQPIPVSAVATMLKDHTAAGQAKTIELTLAPEELGQVRLLMQPDGEKMRIIVQAERPETLEMLRRNTEAFSTELRQSGFANTSFTFGGWGEQPGKSPMQQKNSAGLQTTAGPTVDIPFSTPAPRTSSGLDLRV